MENATTCFPTIPNNPKKPYQLEFKQLKEYYNFQREFTKDRKDPYKQNKPIGNYYYLIDNNWLNDWKFKVGYQQFRKFVGNREANDNDYNIFFSCIQMNKKIIGPLDNSKVYNNGIINCLSEFMIINKPSYEAFNETRKNVEYNTKEKAVILKFVNDRTILAANFDERIIYFKNKQTNHYEELIVKFISGNKEKIISDIENPNLDINIWIKDQDSFDLNVLDEYETEKDGCKYRLINKKLKLKSLVLNQVTPQIANNDTTFVNFKCKIEPAMKAKLQNKLETMKQTFSKMLMNTAKKTNNIDLDLKKQSSSPSPNPIFNNCNPINNNLNFNQQQTSNTNNQQMQQQQMQNPQMMQQQQITPQQNMMLPQQMNGQNIITPQQWQQQMLHYGQMMGNNQIMQQQMMRNNLMMQQQQMMSMQQNFQFNNNINSNNMSGFPNNMNMHNSQNFFNPNMNNMNQINMMNPMNNNMNPMMNQNNNNQINNRFGNFNNMNINNNNNMNMNNNLKMMGSPTDPIKKRKINNFELINNISPLGIIYPHKAGLQNVGQSCYMNATLECLSNVPKLSDELIKRYQNYDIDTQPLVASYSCLLFDLLFTQAKSIEPKTFKEILGQLNPLFEGNHAADAKDLIFFLIETMHKELLSPSNINNNNNVDFAQQEMNSRFEHIMYQEFIKEYNNNKTIISDLFYGINRSIMVCHGGCQITKYSFQTYNLLIFPLKKVKDFKIRRVGRYQNLDLNLYDAFECEQQIEKLEGENMIYCNACKKMTPGAHKQDIYGLPKILIIILNRGKNNQDFNEEFRIDEYLDFSEKRLILNQNSYKKFYLSGIITHLGESGSSGHFIAYCRNNPKDSFLCYNDAAVSKVTKEIAMATKISYNDSEKKTPYILLYHYIE